jgi:hypothetical protein
VTTPAHPGNDYYVNPFTGTIQRQGNRLLAAALTGSGWEGPYNWATAKAQVAGLKAGISAAAPGGLPTAGPGGNILNPVSDLGGINAIGDFFNRLTEPNTWVRVGEVLGGLLLVYIGVSAITRGTPVGDAASTAKSTAGKAASYTPPGKALRVEREARSVVRGKQHAKRVRTRVKVLDK